MTFTWDMFMDSVNFLQLVILIFMLRKIFEKSGKKNDAVKDLINKTTLMTTNTVTLKNRVELAITNFENSTADYATTMKEAMSKIDDAYNFMEGEFKKDREIYREIGKNNGDRLAQELAKYEANCSAIKTEMEVLKQEMSKQSDIMLQLQDALKSLNSTESFDEDIK